MSLHRWSLPKRASTREKSRDEDSSKHVSFSTVHITNPVTRQRANISSTFASLFDKSENRLNATTTNKTHHAADESQPLSPRVENLPSNFGPKDTVSHAEVHSSDMAAGRISKVLRQHSPEREKACSGNLLNGTGHDKSSPEHTITSNDPKSPNSLTRSISSSYPSEGIRSPSHPSHSPQLNTWTESFISELSRYGTYPSEGTSNRSSVSIPINGVRQCLMEELAAAGGVSDTDTRTTSRNFAPGAPLLDTASVRSPQEHRDRLLETCHDCGLITEVIPEVQDPRQTDAIPTVYSRISSTTAIFGSDPELNPAVCISSSEEEFPIRPSNASSSDPLRRSTEPCSTKKIHWYCHDHAYHTMPASTARNGPLRSSITSITTHSEISQSPGFPFADTNASSITLVQRIQKFKFGKWIKKVCLRTKVRFDNVTRLEMSPRSLRRNSKSPKPRRPKRSELYRVKANTVKPRWRSSGGMKKLKKSAKERGGVAHRLMHSLKPKHSLQFPSRRKAGTGHRRVQSCPAQT